MQMLACTRWQRSCRGAHTSVRDCPVDLRSLRLLKEQGWHCWIKPLSKRQGVGQLDEQAGEKGTFARATLRSQPN